MTNPKEKNMSIAIEHLPPQRDVNSAGFSLRDYKQPDRARQTADAAVRATVDAAARDLPDELFADHPGVITTRQAAFEASQRAHKLATMPRRAVAIDDLLGKMEAELVELDASLRFAALDDFIDGATDFPRALAIMDKRDHLAKCIRVARIARVDALKSPPELREFKEMATLAESAQSTILLQLKRQYIQDHPELIGEGAE
jgi:hypothetical protein